MGKVSYLQIWNYFLCLEELPVFIGKKIFGPARFYQLWHQNDVITLHELFCNCKCVSRLRVHQTPLTFLDFNAYSIKNLLMLLEVCMRDMNVIKGGLGVARVTFLFLHTCTVQIKESLKKCIWTVFLIIKSHSKEILFYTTFL